MNLKYNKKDEEKIVLLINEIHHDLEENYEKNNKVMHSLEKKNWNKLLKGFDFKNKKILEIGTGTGFLPIFFIKNRINFKEFVCTDISFGILEKAKKNIKKSNKTNYNFKFKKLKDISLPFEEDSFDIIVMNSVLHHLPNLKIFYKEANRVLKKNGLLIIGHEPNYYFYKNKILNFNYKFLRKILILFGKIKFKIFKERSYKQELINKINENLKKKKLITKNLSLEEINQFIDYGAKKGINYRETYNFFILKKVYTYNYLFTLNFSYNFYLWNLFINFYEFLFSKIFKKSGGNYFVIYQNKK